MQTKHRALCVLAAIMLCLSLFGCETTYTIGESAAAPTTAAQESQPWYEIIKEHAFYCHTDKYGNLYYNDEQGVWRCNANELEAECVIPKAWLHFIDESYLYYFTPFTVVRASLSDLEKKETLLSQQQLEAMYGYEYPQEKIDEYPQSEFQRQIKLYKNILVLQWHASLLIAYDLNKQKAYQLTDYVGSQGFAITDDYIYFSEWRDFRVFRVPLKSLGRKPELILGTEETWWTNRGGVTLYDEFAAVHGQLYFTQRTPEWLWRFDENGNHKLLYEYTGSGGECFYLFAADDKIYFDWSTGISGSQNRVLYCYDPKTDKVTIACDSEEFSFSYGHEVRILRDRVFFLKHTSEDDSQYEILSAALN
jgi:hypothetical protein